MESPFGSPAHLSNIYKYFIESGVVKDENGDIKNKENYFYICRICLEKNKTDKNGKPRGTNCIRGHNSNLHKHIRTAGHEDAFAELKNCELNSSSKKRKLD